MDKLRAIKFFCRAVEDKSFTAAAHALDVPPSALSKGISGLERSLKFTLFNRSTRRLSLTEAGARYYESCRQLLLDMEEAEAAARDSTVELTGTLKIGYHPIFRITLCRRIREFLAANPRLDVDLALTNAPATLLEDGLDVVLRVGRVADSTFVARQLGWTALIACASPSYLDTPGRPSHPKDLSVHRAIIPGRRDEEPFTRWTFRRGKDRETVTVPIAVVFREGIGIVDAAVWGAGVVQIYDVAARPFVESGDLERILTDWTCERQPIYAVVPSRRNVTAKVRAFTEFARSFVITS
jgi:LysR family transcriptional regulator for bpeEF and oprC